MKKTYEGLPRLALSLLVALSMVLGLCPAGLADEAMTPEPEQAAGEGLAQMGEETPAPAQGVELVAAQGGELGAQTDDSVTYLDDKGNEQTCTEYAVISGDSGQSEWTAGWYVVRGEATRADRIAVSGAVHLILEDGATLNASAGITVTGDNSLTIYAQSTGDGVGELVATGGDEAAGIGGVGPYGSGFPTPMGTLTVNGGTVTATGGNSGAGIGGCYAGAGGALTVNGGTVQAKGGGNAAGIGGGNGGACGAVTVNGGTVTAEGGQYAAGIGGAAGVPGGTVTVAGGTVEAKGGDKAAGIGGGYYGAGGEVAVTGGEVTATGRDGAAGIGRGCNGGESNKDTVEIGPGLLVEAGGAAPGEDHTEDFETNHNDYPYAQVYPATYKISVAARPEEGGTARADKEGAKMGEAVELEAEEADGYAFAGWTVEPSDTGATLSDASSPTAKLTVGAANVTAIASFEKKVVMSVAVDPATVTLKEGETRQLTATVEPGDAADRTVTWGSSNEGVAKVDASGKVTAVSAGTATVTATANDGSGKSGSCAVTVTKDEPATTASVTYRGHAQDVGDLAAVRDGATLGTVGQARRLELFAASVSGIDGASISYRAHLQDTGWGQWAKDGGRCGTVGESRRIEAVQMALSGADGYHVWYRVHCQDLGWLGWACDGQAAGTIGQSKRIEAIEVKVLPDGADLARELRDYVEGKASYVGAVTGQAHVQDQGWEGTRSSTEFGTTGLSRRLEAVRLSLSGQPLPGGLSYDVHVQGTGWVNGARDGEVAGTTGQSRRLEAVRISLTGEMADSGAYSVWYRVHSQDYGWLGWTHDGREAGTTGLSRRAEAIDVQVLPAGQQPAGYDAGQAACVAG